MGLLRSRGIKWPVKQGVVDVLVASIETMRTKDSGQILALAESREMAQLLRDGEAWIQELILAGISAGAFVRQVIVTSSFDASSTKERVADLAAEYCVVPSMEVQPCRVSLLQWVFFLAGDPVESKAEDLTLESYWSVVSILVACMQIRSLGQKHRRKFIEIVARNIEDGEVWTTSALRRTAQKRD